MYLLFLASARDSVWYFGLNEHFCKCTSTNSVCAGSSPVVCVLWCVIIGTSLHPSHRHSELRWHARHAKSFISTVCGCFAYFRCSCRWPPNRFAESVRTVRQSNRECDYGIGIVTSVWFMPMEFADMDPFVFWCVHLCVCVCWEWIPSSYL